MSGGRRAGHVKRGRPVWEWVKIWEAGHELDSCDCAAAPRCDAVLLLCDARRKDYYQRVHNILAYRDPDWTFEADVLALQKRLAAAATRLARSEGR